MLLGNAHKANAQEIADGTYIGHRGGIIPKYIIMVVNGDIVQFEMFTRWQGSWLPCIGEWNGSYEPQLLKINKDGSLTNENMIVEHRQGKKLRLIGIAKKTFSGKVKFDLVKKDELPDRYRIVKTKAMEFIERSKT